MFERRALGEFDWVLLAAMSAATALGLVMLYSSTYLNGGAIFYRQLMWLTVAVALIWGAFLCGRAWRRHTTSNT